MSEKQIKRPTAKEGELIINSQDNGHLINQYIVQLLVEKDSPEEIKELMRAELDYNKERLGIMREHAEKHPDAIEDRKAKGFRRTQYAFLMVIVPVLLIVIFFLPTAIALALCTIVMIIIAGIVLNGRDRDSDSEALIKLLDKLTRRES